MVTGDNLDTAKAISLNAGILTEEDIKQEWSCIEGQKFRNYVGPVVQDKDAKSGLAVERPTDVARF